MTYVLIAGIVAASAGLVALALINRSQSRQLGTLTTDLIAAGKREIAATHNMETAARQRDDERGLRVKAEAERDDALRSLALVMADRNRLAEEKAQRVKDKIAAGTAADAVDALNGVLGKDLRQASATGSSAASDRGEAGPSALRSADLAGTNQNRRVP